MLIADSFTKGVVMAVVFFVLGSILGVASAAEYPSKPLEIVVPFAAGSDPDLVARVVADVGSKHFGQPIVVVPKPGAAGAIAVADVISSKPDGYKVIWHSHAYYATTWRTQKVPFDVNDIVPIANFYEMKQGMAVKGDSPYKTFNDLRDHAKKRPGQLKWAGGGRGTALEMSGMLVLRKAGLDMVYLPYKGSSEVSVALLGGHTDAAVLPVATVFDHVRAGTIRFLMVFSDKRYEDHPNIPTAPELGFPDAALPSYWGIYVRRDTPETVKKVLADVSKKIFDDPDFRKGIARLGGQTRYGDPEFIREAIKKQEKIGIPILKELGLLVEK